MRRSLLSLAMIAALASTVGAQGRGDGPRRQMPPRPDDPIGHLVFPPELVMRHQGELNLSDAQRATLQQAMQQAQTKFVDVQWRLSSEAEALAKLVQPTTVDESAALAQVNRILTLEREMKLAQMTLMVRVKNTLTQQQQAKLQELRQTEMRRPREDEPERP